MIDGWMLFHASNTASLTAGTHPAEWRDGSARVAGHASMEILGPIGSDAAKAEGGVAHEQRPRMTSLNMCTRSFQAPPREYRLAPAVFHDPLLHVAGHVDRTRESDATRATRLWTHPTAAEVVRRNNISTHPLMSRTAPVKNASATMPAPWGERYPSYRLTPVKG